MSKFTTPITINANVLTVLNHLGISVWSQNAQTTYIGMDLNVLLLIVLLLRFSKRVNAVDQIDPKIVAKNGSSGMEKTVSISQNHVPLVRDGMELNVQQLILRAKKGTLKEKIIIVNLFHKNVDLPQFGMVKAVRLQITSVPMEHFSMEQHACLMFPAKMARYGVPNTCIVCALLVQSRTETYVFHVPMEKFGYQEEGVNVKMENSISGLNVSLWISINVGIFRILFGKAANVSVNKDSIQEVLSVYVRD